MSIFSEDLKNFSKKFNKDIEKCFPLVNGAEKRVVEAMSYSVMNGGKRLRPYLVYACAELYGIEYEKVFPVAASLEMLHTYSLIHDDLPAMDNDTLRRGKPTCHIQFDEATAILAGDGLLTQAFDFLSHAIIINPDVRLTLIQLLAEAAGAYGGMVSGQMLDLSAGKNEDNPQDIISRIELMKTGRLLRYACEAGAVLGQAPLKERELIIDYARKIGQAFQIADDILDKTGDEKTVGKTLHKDDSQNKFTFVSFYGIDKAKIMAEQLVNEAISSISIFGDKAQKLSELAHYIIERTY